MAKVTPKKVDKPWGYEEWFAKTDRYVGKVIFVKAGEALSLQYHRVKDETIRVVSGRIELVVGENRENLESHQLSPGDAFHIPPRTIHRIIAVEDTTLFEVSTPEVEDVVRLEDRYGREDPDANG